MRRALVILFLLVPGLLLHARPTARAAETCPSAGVPAPKSVAPSSSGDPACPCCALADSCCCSVNEPAPSKPAPAPAPAAPRSAVPDFTAVPDRSSTLMPLPPVVDAVLPDIAFRLPHRPAASPHALLCVWRT